VLPEATGSALLATQAAGWTTNESGEMELRDWKTGAVVYGAFGDPITLDEWLLDQKNGRGKFLFGSVANGGGTGGSTGGGGRNRWSKRVLS
jgi:hypothetical protein